MKALENWDSWTGIKELSCLCKAGWNGWTFQLSIVNVFESYDQSRKWGFDKRRKSKSTTYRFREWRHSTDVLLSRSKTLRVGLHGNLAERPEFYNYDSDLLQHGGACRSAVKTCVRPKLKAWIWRCQHHFASFAGDFVPCSFTTCFPPKKAAEHDGCRTWQLKDTSSMPLLLQLSIKLAVLRSVSTLKHYERSAKICMLHPMSEPVKSNSDTHDTPCICLSPFRPFIKLSLLELLAEMALAADLPERWKASAFLRLRTTPRGT